MKNAIARIVYLLIVVLTPTGSVIAKTTAKPDTQWFQETGFGMFLHWGAYAQFAGRYEGEERTKDLWGEWIMRRANISIPAYEAVARQFNPTNFNPKSWADLAREAGMGYVVLTAKHHDGFAMYHSRASPYNIVDFTPFKRDPVEELAKACRADRLHFGVYYSHIKDWHNNTGNDASSFDRYFTNIAIPQVRELLTRYGPMDIVWFDQGDHPHAAPMLRVVRQLQPNALVSSRIGGGLGDFKCMGDSEVPPRPVPPPWETCMTLNYHWAFYPQDVYEKSAAEVIRMLVEIRSKGGNLLLDVGPDNEGNLPPRAVFVLREVGKWMKTFNASVKSVTASPVGDVSWGCVTHGKDRTLYLHVFEWPSTGQILLPGIKGAIERAWMLGDPKRTSLPVARKGNLDSSIAVPLTKIPAEALSSVDTVIAVKLAPGADFETTRCVDPDFENVFSVATAQLNGCHFKNTRSTWYDLDPANQIVRYDANVPDLTNANSSTQWNFRSDEPADYHIQVEYAAGETVHDKIALTIDDKVLSADIIPAWDNPGRRFRTFRIGTLTLPAGSHKMLVHLDGKTEPNGKFLFKSVKLVPTRTTPVSAATSKARRKR